jgi:integrase
LKSEAKELEDRIKLSVYEGKDVSRKAITVGEFVEEVFWPWALVNYKSPLTSYAFHVRAVKEYFGATTLRDITPMQVEKFKQHRVGVPKRWGGDRCPQTVNHDLRALSRIFSMARDNGLINENPCSRVKLLRVDNKRTRYLTAEEEGQLMAVLVGRFSRIRPIVIFALNTGMRRGEILNLRWSDIDRERNVIEVRKTKTFKGRSVPMNDRVVEVLAGRAEATTGDKVFDMSATALTLLFARLAKRAGLAYLRFHDLRHTFATRLADADVDPFTIAEILGHSDLNMTKRYTHALDVNKRRAVDALQCSTEVEQTRTVSTPAQKPVTKVSQSDYASSLSEAGNSATEQALWEP